MIHNDSFLAFYTTFFAYLICLSSFLGRVVSPIWARRPDILKIDNRWKTQIQKFKTTKQAIKFV